MKTKITTITTILIVSLLILPSVTFASWWNPFTWFQKTVPAPQVQVQKEEQKQDQKQVTDVISDKTSTDKVIATSSDRLVQIENRVKEINAEFTSISKDVIKAARNKDNVASKTASAKVRVEELSAELNTLQKEKYQIQSGNTNILTPSELASSSNLGSIFDKKVYTDTKNGFSIIPPKGWIMDNSGAHGAKVTFTNDKDKNSWIEVASGYSKEISVSKIASDTINLFKTITPKFNLLEDKAVKLGNDDAHLISFSYSDSKQNNKTMVMTLVFVIKNNLVYHSGSNVAESDWKTEKDVIEASLLSLRFK